MNFVNFNPSLWTNKELDRLINLWIEYESIAKSCKEVNKKIKVASEKNDSFKDEIQTSTDRCNEIIDKEKIISIESASEIVQLSKTIREIRIQEDEIEKEIAKYRDELVELIEQRNNIIKEVNELGEVIKSRNSVQASNVSGNIIVQEVHPIELNVVDYSKAAVISLPKSGAIICKSVFAENYQTVIKAPEFLIDRINLCESIKEYNESVLQEEIKEIDERKKNYLASIEASELALKTEKELSSEVSPINLNFIEGKNVDVKEENSLENVNADKVEISIDDEPEVSINIEENKQDNIVPISISDENVATEEKTAVEESTVKNIVPEQIVSAAKETVAPENQEQKVVAQENTTPNPVPEQMVNTSPEGVEVTSTPVVNSEQKEENVKPLGINIQEEVQTKAAQDIPVATSESVTPLNTGTESKVENNVNVSEPTGNNEVTQSVTLGEKVDLKKNTIANAKLERVANIEATVKNKVNATGVTPMDTGSSLPGFRIGNTLESAKKLINLRRQIQEQSLNNVEQEGVSNIFGSPAEEVKPLKMAY